jgi:protein subunit release factor A
MYFSIRVSRCHYHIDKSGWMRVKCFLLCGNVKEIVMSKRMIEIRAGEGGIDSQQFVAELGKAYLAMAHREG